MKKFHVYIFSKEHGNFLATLWLGALYDSKMRLDEYLLNSWHHDKH